MEMEKDFIRYKNLIKKYFNEDYINTEKDIKELKRKIRDNYITHSITDIQRKDLLKYIEVLSC
jgi:uncharacterized protein Yka (UPF0111/DUF47 family)